MSSRVASPHFLLTGATGLVGRFVLAELLGNDQSVTCVLRARDQLHAAQRIEQALENFEQDRLLPRPRILVGDLLAEQLGLSDHTIGELAQLPLIVIHCAASIRFNHDTTSGEPYATNVQGTQHLLHLCQTLNLRAWHQVSTAYVGCRTQERLVPERIIDDVELGGNDYEKSKIEAEKLVRATGLPVTLHRPSIVIGDSRTGFTSTFHGFYAPLQIASQFAKQYGFSPSAADLLRQRLGLAADDRKNLVPVDWVAAGIVRVALADTVPTASNTNCDALSEPRVLHWTNPNPVRCQDIQEAIVRAIEERYGFGRPPSSSQIVEHAGMDPKASPAPSVTGEQFESLMSAYTSYFRSDPDFADSQARAACPWLRCPAVDLDLLTHLARFAIQANFGWPRPPMPNLPQVALVQALRCLPRDTNTSFEAQLRLSTVGPGAPETQYYGRTDGKWFSATEQQCVNHRNCGTNPGKRLDCTIPIACLAKVLKGEFSLAEAMDSGMVFLVGQPAEAGVELLKDWMDSIKETMV